MISFFTTCKDFSGLTKIHQYNALRSWRKLFPNDEILIFGKEHGICPIAKEIEASRFPSDINYGAGGTPYVNKLFLQAQERAWGEWVCYINADIIVTSSFKKVIRRAQNACLHREWGNCLMIGQKWDVVLDREIQFDKPDWENKLIASAKKKGRPHFRKGKGRGADYFFFKRSSLWDEMPAFLIHRLWWDTFLPWYAAYGRKKGKVPVLDATESALVIHPLHPKPKPPADEVRRNQSLAEGHWMYCFDAPWVITPDRCFLRRL